MCYFVCLVWLFVVILLNVSENFCVCVISICYMLCVSLLCSLLNVGLLNMMLLV